MTESVSDDAGPGDSRKKLGCLWVIGTALVLTVVGVIAVRWAFTAQAQARIDAIKAAGEPVTFADVVATIPPAPSPGRNAVSVIVGLTLNETVMDSDRGELLPWIGMAETPAPHEPLSSLSVDAMREHFRLNAVAVEDLMGIADLEADWVSRGAANWNDYFANSRLSLLRQASLQLADVAALAAEDGDAARAARCLAAMWRIVEIADRDPTFIGRLVASALAATVSRVTDRVVNRVALSPAALRDLIGRSQRLDDATRLHAVMLVERAVAIDSIDELEIDQDDLAAALGHEWVGPIAFWCYHAFAIDDLDFAALLEVETRMADAMTYPMPRRLTEVRAAVASAPAWSLLCDMVLPALDRLLVIDGRSISDVRLTHAVMALEIYERREGRYPDALADLPPDLAAYIESDPFTGKPFGYTRLDDGFRIWGTSDDAIDNGGAKENSSGREYEPGADIVYEVRPNRTNLPTPGKEVEPGGGGGRLPE